MDVAQGRCRIVVTETTPFGGFSCKIATTSGVAHNDMSILLVLGGIASLVYGTLTVLGVTNDLSRDSDLDKKLLSERSRYFLGRYYTGFEFITAGLGAFALGLIIYFSHWYAVPVTI